MTPFLRIALLGTRGVPASYSGFETCVEQLGCRLAERGHEVTVYCRSHHITHPDAEYRGMRLVKLPTIPNKYLDTLAHSFISSCHALPRRFDVALYFIAGNSVVTWIPRLVGTKSIINVDGLDWRRDKWPALAKRYLQLAERLATVLPNKCITDSHVVQQFYREHYGHNPDYIPYGSEIDIIPPGETLERFGLEPRRYVLFVGRLVPENCAHHLVEAFLELHTDLKCVIVGDAPYAADYIASLKRMAKNDPRIVFTGYVFGRGYQELGSSAGVFVETSGVGGTHPALVEAMAFGNCVIVHNTPENLETIADAGLAYDGGAGAESLHHVLGAVLDDEGKVSEFRERAYRRARTVFTWEAVTDAYERAFYEVTQRDMPARLRDVAT